MRNKEKFTERQIAYIDEQLIEIRKKLLIKLESAMLSGAIPDKWKEKDRQGNYESMLGRAVIDSFCKDNPYYFWYDAKKKDSANLHKFI